MSGCRVWGRLSSAGLWAAGSVWMPAAFAQDVQTTGDRAVELEAVQVLGSRIRRADAVESVPVQTVSSEDIAKSGLRTIGEILQELSVSGSALNTKFNSAGNFGFPPDGGGVGSGSTTVSLRNLGAKRTLVLVDGIRWINESSASGVSASVDLNTIPASAVERIELLTDGASSLYGSDAIAGVVNVVTKRSQEGMTVDAYGGDYKLSGGTTKSASVTFGGKLDKLDMFFDLDYFKQQSISSAEWEQSSYPIPGTGVTFGSSAIPYTRTVFTPPDPSSSYGGLCPIDPASGTSSCDIVANGTAPDGVQSFPSDFHAFSTEDRFNFAPYNLLLTPSERKTIFTQLHYTLTPWATAYVKGLYQNRESVNQAAPEPIFIGPGAGTGGLADTVGVDASNPYNPFGVTLDPATNLALATRRPVEGGPRIFTQDVDTFYVSGGFQGSFGFMDRSYDWDVNAVNGRAKATQTVTGTYNIAHIQRALGPVDECTDPCVPLNFFGGEGSITPEMLDYIQFTENDRSEQNLYLWSANLTGPIIDLPAGPLSFATGYENRRLSGYYTPDSIVTAGETNGVPSSPTSGGYSVDELYLELSVPLLADRFLARSLELSLATRYSDYSTFGNTTNNKYGIRWQMFRDLTLRGTFAEGFRAPSIGELYSSASRFDATLEDPCSNATDPAIIANCTGLGVPTGFEQANTQISVSTGGNSDLDPETSDSISAGFVYSPRWAENLSWSKRIDVTMTYYHIKVEDAIQALDAQTQLDRCVSTLDPVFCGGISRASTGDINGFDNTLLNLGTIKTEGYDASIEWALPSYSFGKLSTALQATYVEKYEAVSDVTGLPEPERVGVEVSDSAIPRVRGLARLNWAYDQWSANWTARYISSLEEDCGDAVDFDVCSDPEEGKNRLGSVTYHDVRAQWALPIRLDTTIAAGVNNLFGKDPPVCLSCSLNGYDASVYDLPGQYAYLQATVHY